MATTVQARNGQFSRGVPGGVPVNFYGTKMAALRRAVYRTLNATEIQAIAQKLVDLAKKGNVPCIKLALAYAIGTPEQTIEVRHQQNPNDSLPRQIQTIIQVNLAGEAALDK